MNDKVPQMWLRTAVAQSRGNGFCVCLECDPWNLLVPTHAQSPERRLF